MKVAIRCPCRISCRTSKILSCVATWYKTWRPSPGPVIKIGRPAYDVSVVAHLDQVSFFVSFTMAELDDRFVKRGYWVDWSKGSVMGQTYTVDAQTGTLIVAVLTILASVATAQLWSLLTFVLHQFRAHGTASEGLFWQQQALLRTMPTPTAFLADSFKLSWAWRSKVRHSVLRSLPVLAFAVFFTIGSIAGGISTSYAVDNSNIEVLVDSPFCG